MSITEKSRQEQREAKIMDFVFSALITAVGASGGRSLPEDENARDLVRIARTAYSELDEPTEPTEKEEDPTPLDTEEPQDLFEQMLG